MGMADIELQRHFRDIYLSKVGCVWRWGRCKQRTFKSGCKRILKVAASSATIQTEWSNLSLWVALSHNNLPAIIQRRNSSNLQLTSGPLDHLFNSFNNRKKVARSWTIKHQLTVASSPFLSATASSLSVDVYEYNMSLFLAQIGPH